MPTSKIALNVKTQPSSFSDGKLSSNASLDPIPIGSKDRKWKWPSMVGFWIAEAFSISMYQVASSAIVSGLSPGLSILAIFVGHIIISIPAMLNAYVGAQRGINFPISMRYTFGVYGAYFGVFVRGCVALLWFGTQTYQGGQAMALMISAIWPSFKHFPNELPESAHVTSSELLCFFIFLIVQMPVLFLTVNQLRYLFYIKIVFMPIFGLALFGWAVSSANGFGPLFHQGNRITDGTPVGVVFFRCVISVISPKATLALNIADFTRFATKPKQALWPQFVGLVVLVSLCGILGIVVTSAAYEVYGVLTWNPLEVSVLWDNRAAQFFSALMWSLAVIGTNISANSVSFANDLSLCFPKVINPRRGALICCVLSILTNPWQIQNSAASFTKFLGGYSIFLAPIASIMIVDYYILRKQVMDVHGLYILNGPYYFFKGFNIPAFIAFVCGISPNLPGLAWSIGSKNIPIGAVYLYSVSYITGFTVSGSIYYCICRYIPKLWMADIETVTDEIVSFECSSNSDITRPEKNVARFDEKDFD
ncbi:hypothetical protein CANTEDRAFT_135089 [Yamadazyma tenuis ATCC 10573]|uniref:Allantoin permease n=1 Tax=Candida tenuis (strain ATCC 10573 / BCRC 21748 / CBS 615 / JCM 9827 / NBRC 10315 / NRRL Y-1498 / VKM Y-70) TaxID=590646 RepID=G3B5M3_CANTC|nr:uncharacterized protein CANTEDRAFT_135089 [Yamadazyma tenuis ATCC 10573]EGV63262.1 hypothetical protein CANTEDRAFT_135089 [Yamadazyma tenuis ATCC 10573]